MPEVKAHISKRGLRTPRAAAIAGILFAVLMVTSFIMIQLSIPADSTDSSDWLEEEVGNISIALSLLPFAGIAFLWFMGVVRDRIGLLEDQFFSTLFFGSGLLYLAMSFASAAIAGGILAVYVFDPDALFTSGIYSFSQGIIYKFSNVFAIRMAGMHMIVLGTIWVRTEVMPRWMALATFLLAVVLLVSIQFLPWVTLVFPAWVFLISAYILVLNYRYERQDVKMDGMTVKN
ncbi:MAG: hypothetical protein ABUK20_11245 [Anaerolineales bacterium]